MEIYTFTPDEEQKNLRIDKFLSEQLPDQSRSYLQKLLKEGNVTVNEKTVKANYKVQLSDTVKLELPEPECPDILPEDIPLDILYEDEDVLIINKPKGMVVHPSAGHYTHTVVNAVMFHCKEHLSGINGVMRPGIVHRIDMDTTGAIVICKNDMAHQSLADQLKEHSITRKYRALVHGNLKEDELCSRNKCYLFVNCLIEGTTDFIFGSATAYFKECTILSKKNSYITAASTCKGQQYGFIFDSCSLIAAKNVDHVFLGRPWRIHAQTVFFNCFLGTHICPEGWSDWKKAIVQSGTAFYAEYNNKGPGAGTGKRVVWSRQLTSEEIEKYKLKAVWGEE